MNEPNPYEYRSAKTADAHSRAIIPAHVVSVEAGFATSIVMAMLLYIGPAVAYAKESPVLLQQLVEFVPNSAVWKAVIAISVGIVVGVVVYAIVLSIRALMSRF